MSFSTIHPFEEHEVAEYEKKRYRGWDQKIVHRREEKILSRILGFIEENSLRRVSGLALDAPCGFGRFSNLIRKKGFLPVNVDLSLAMVKRAHERKYSGQPSWGIVADVKAGLPFRREAFDFILSMRFFHHLHHSEERRKVLKEFAGASFEWLILSFYQKNSLHRIQRKLRRRLKKSKTRIKMIARETFLHEVEEAGFRMVRIVPLLKGIHAHHIALLRKS